MLRREGKKRGGWGVLVVCAVLFTVFTLMGRRGAAPTPDAFVDAVALHEAHARSASDGRAVLALVTADWCAPCQELKRTALADQQINLWIRQNVHAVYVDATKDNPVAGELKVFSLPTMLVLRDGKEVSRLEGLRGTAEVRAWLTAATGPVADWKHAHPGQPLPTGG